jgi:DNA-binding IclR family transcriptional regulator
MSRARPTAGTPADRRPGAAREPDGQGVKSAERALAIFELLSERERAYSFVEMTELLGYPRSSLHGLLRTLTDRSWLELDPNTRRYSLGIRAWQAGQTYLRTIELDKRAAPYMERVRDELDETVQLSILDGRYNIYIGKAEGGQRLGLASEVGRRLQAHATGLGKVLLSGLPDDDVSARFAGVTMEAFTPNTITDVASLLRELATIRARGHAEDNEEYTLGVRCIAVPVRDHQKPVAAAISVSVPTVRFDAARRRATLRALKVAADDLSTALGAGAPTGVER